MKAITKIFDGKPQRLDQVAVSTDPKQDRRIRTVAVLNNTPFFLYVGREQHVGRENALFVVEPYTDVIQPVSEAQALFVNEGPAVGVVPANCQATIMWGPEIYQHGTRRTSRNVVIPLIDGPIAKGAVSTNLGAQGVTPAGPGSAGPAQFSVPAGAQRRTLYAVVRSGTVDSIKLEGSANGDDWGPLPIEINGSIPPALSLPPYLRVVTQASTAANMLLYMMVDL